MTDGNDLEGVGDKLLHEFATNFKMVLEYADTLEGEQQLKFIAKLESTVNEIEGFIDELGLNVNDIGVQ